MRSTWLACAVALVAAAPAAVAHNPVSREPGKTHFGAEVRVTPQLGAAGAAQVAVDRHGNTFVVATKGELPVSPNLGGSPPARALPWLRASLDDGVTWRDLSLTIGGGDALVPGDAVAVASDDTGRTFVLQAAAGRALLARFASTGRGVITAEPALPVPGVTGAGPRPLVAAHGDGRMVVLDDRGTAGALGRYAALASADRGQSWSPAGGVALTGSDECGVAADRRKGSRAFYAACTEAGGTIGLWATADDGATWRRTKVGSFDATWADHAAPAVAVASDGSVYVLFADSAEPGTATGVPDATRLKLWRSRDAGRRWTFQDVTPGRGIYLQPALGASFHGRLGISVLRPKNDPQRRWFIEAAIFRPGTKPKLVNFADHVAVTAAHHIRPAPEPLSLTFGRDNMMSVLWLHDEERVAELDRTIVRELWFCRTLPSTRI